jgi:hypothetical protein
MHGLQEPELHDHEKPQEASGTHGNEEILQYVPEANSAQRSEIARVAGRPSPFVPFGVSG